MKRKPGTSITETSELYYGDRNSPRGLSLWQRDDDDVDDEGCFKSEVITNVYKLYHWEIVLVVTFIRSEIFIVVMIHVLMAIIRRLLMV